MDESAAWIVEAFQKLALPIELSAPDGPGGDLRLSLWDEVIVLDVLRLSSVSEDSARRIANSSPERSPVHRTRLVVADRVTATARSLLLGAGVGYLDLRGHLALRASGLLIDSDVDLGWIRSERTDALGGKVGLEVATALLMQPDRGPAVRELAREIERSPSTVSEVLARLRAEDRITSTNRVLDERLFWDVVERWPEDRLRIAELPPAGQYSRLTVPLQLGIEDVERSTGWALTDTAAAAAFGAPIAVRADQPLDFYVPTTSILRRAQTLLGSAVSASAAACTLRVAPVPAVCDRRIDAAGNYPGWPSAHPVFVALDLAQDAGRGRDVLTQWKPEGGWSRVW